jgi:hypothetical protein
VYSRYPVYTTFFFSFVSVAGSPYLFLCFNPEGGLVSFRILLQECIKPVKVEKSDKPSDGKIKIHKDGSYVEETKVNVLFCAFLSSRDRFLQIVLE